MASEPDIILNSSPGVRAVRLLRRWIDDGRLIAGERLPSERTLADMLEVSRGAVRAALRRLESEGLLRESESEGRVVVVRNFDRRVMARTIAILCGVPFLSSLFGRPGYMEEVEIGAMEAIAEAGMNVFRIHPERMSEDGVEPLLQERPRGVVITHWVGEHWNDERMYAKFREMGVPAVVNGGAPYLSQCDRVISDHNAGSAELTRWLIAKGRKRILRMWGGTPTEYWMLARNAGHERVMREAGLALLPSVSLKAIRDPGNGKSQAEYLEVCRRLIAGFLAEHLLGSRPIEAVMVTTDFEAYVANAALRLLGRKPNEDVLVVGYDNLPSDAEVEKWEPEGPAATMDRLDYETGRRMMELLLARIENRLPPEPQCMVITPKMVVKKR